MAVCNMSVLDSLNKDSMLEMAQCWNEFCLISESIVTGKGDSFCLPSQFDAVAQTLCKHGLQSLAQQHLVRSIEQHFERNAVKRFWRHFEPYSSVTALDSKTDRLENDDIHQVLCNALEELSSEKRNKEKCLKMLMNALQCHDRRKSDIITISDDHQIPLFLKFELMISSVLMSSLPRHFPEVLQWYFKGQLKELSTEMEVNGDGDNGLETEDAMDVDGKSKPAYCSSSMDIDGSTRRSISETDKSVTSVGIVVRDLRSIGLTSMAEDAYASAIYWLLKAKVQDLAGEDFHNSVLDLIKGWIQSVPLRFLRALLAFLGDSNISAYPSSGTKSPLASRPSSFYFKTEVPSEELVRWQLRLEYFAYETLQDLRIAKLFEIIVDYPDSVPAIEDLKSCLEYTGQHAKLVDSFISSLRHRLLTAGASTNDILHQYVSTIKALRTIDPAGVFLEAVSEPIREYLRGRKDTIKCIVTMLTDGTGGTNSVSGSTGDSLLEELNRDEDNQENRSADDDINIDDKQAWINAQGWEPDPVQADLLKGSRNYRKVDILGMIVGIIGSKDQLVSEYRVMLAEKLLNKSDYDIDSEIRTLELLKIHFGEGSMLKCEIMLNDLIESKRTNANIKATLKQQSHSVPEQEKHEKSLDILNATIISSNFWPPIQDEAITLPSSMEQLLGDYSKKFTEIKTPRKLLWKKNLGTVKLELEFEDRVLPFTVTPLQASLIMQFQEHKSWTSTDLAATVGVPVDVLHRRISFWISKGVISESGGGDDNNDHTYTLVETMADSGKAGANSGSCEELIACDEDGNSAVASVEDQLRKEMTVYEKFITGMLTNFGSMALERIHNTLKMFCTADPRYDKSLQQLQSFLSGLVAEEKLEVKDGVYVLRK